MTLIGFGANVYHVHQTILLQMIYDVSFWFIWPFNHVLSINQSHVMLTPGPMDVSTVGLFINKQCGTYAHT